MGFATLAKLHCTICAQPYEHNFISGKYHGLACSKPCFDEFELRRAASVMGKVREPVVPKVQHKPAALQVSPSLPDTCVGAHFLAAAPSEKDK